MLCSFLRYFLFLWEILSGFNYKYFSFVKLIAFTFFMQVIQNCNKLLHAAFIQHKYFFTLFYKVENILFFFKLGLVVTDFNIFENDGETMLR